MIRWSMMLGIASAEARLARRLVRYWVFVVIAALAAIFSFAQLFFIHRLFSAVSASAASANARYFVGNFGATFLVFFFVGIVFLAFDIRARDRRERIHEVVDALPVSNLELVLGRAAGLFFAGWVPVAIVTALLMLAAWLLGNPIEPWSVLGLLTLMSIPALAFAVGVVFLVTLLVRHRLVAALLSLAVLAGLFVVGVWFLKLWASPLTDVTGGYSVTFPSDIVPGIADLNGWIQRVGYLLAALGLLGLSAAVHPRRDDSNRGATAAVSGALVLSGFAVCGYVVMANKSMLARRVAWRAAHEARAAEPAPDVARIAGEVSIGPDRLRLAIDLELRAPAGAPLEKALFSLNPGIVVREARSASGQTLAFTHRDGLLDVTLGGRLAPGEATSIALVAEGRPEPSFAYLDGVLDPLDIKGAEGQVILLGFEPMILEKRFAALLPGLRWLPAAGVDTGRGDSRDRPIDFFTLDLTVDAPGSWTVAGPGRRETVAGASAGRARVRFAPSAPLRDVALVAGRFESRSAEIGGVRFELLLHPGHMGNAEFFSDATSEIEEWLGARLDEARNVGLGYPYDAMTFVEVPNALRGYGGGWRMDSAMMHPAMILVRESSFPTANFETRRERFEQAREREGGIARAKREALELFFANDVNGGNPFVAAARSFFGFQTAGTGAEALPLDYVWEMLASELVTQHGGYFSIHFFDQDFGQEFVTAAQSMNDPNRVADSYSDLLVHNIVSTHAVWNAALATSLRDLEPREDPKRTLNVLALKGGAMADSMLDDLGRETTGRLLAAIRESHLGETYTRADVLAAGQSVGVDLSEWLAVWIDETTLPGFRVVESSQVRLADAADGAPRYQTSVTISNGETAPGLLRVEYRTTEQEDTARWQRVDPVRIPGQGAMRVGFVTSNRVRDLRIVPYLALNRDPFNVRLPEPDEEKLVREEPFIGSIQVDWQPEADARIVVDDLDEGFSIEGDGGRSLLRVAGRATDKEEDLDQGIPIARFGLRAERWSRLSYPEAWGRYRRTTAVTKAGDGKRIAAFRAELPRSGPWQLEYHYAGWSGLERQGGLKPGSWTIVIEDSSGKHEAVLDANQAQVGWNPLGSFEIAAGEVVVRIADSAADGGRFVQADAIRWTPPEGATGPATVAAALEPAR